MDTDRKIAATAPDGTVYEIGETVAVGQDGYYRKADDPIIYKRIAGFFDGDWSRDAKDVRSAYFQFEDEWKTRPWLVSKIRS